MGSRYLSEIQFILKYGCHQSQLPFMDSPQHPECNAGWFLDAKSRW